MGSNWSKQLPVFYLETRGIYGPEDAEEIAYRIAPGCTFTAQLVDMDDEAPIASPRYR